MNRLFSPLRARFPFGLSWPLLIGALSFLSLLVQPGLLNDADAYWHVAAGRWMLEHGQVPSLDPFSHTALGKPWMAHEWLAEIFFALAYRAGGWGGVVSLTAAAYACAFALLARYLLRHLEPIRVLLLLAMAWGLAASHMLARPHALILPLLVCWCVGLASARETDSSPAPGFALCTALWANLHGSFPLALVLAGVFSVEAVLSVQGSERRIAIRQWGVFLLIAFLATLLSPHGLGAWYFVFDLHGMSFSLSIIEEWKSPDFHRWSALEIFFLAAVALALLRGLRLPPLRLALLLWLAHLSLKHMRHAELLGLLAPIIFAQPLAAQLKDPEPSGPSQLDRWFALLSPPAARIATLLVCVSLAGVSLALLSSSSIQPGPRTSPAAAVQAAQAAAPPGPVFNAYDFGGYLIFAGIPPYVDGRTDPFGDAFIKEYYQAVMLHSGELLPRLLACHGIGWTLLQPGQPAVALLDRLPGWQRLYADEIAVVHVRRGASLPCRRD